MKEPKTKQVYDVILIRKRGIIEKHSCHALDQAQSWINTTKDLLGFRVIYRSVRSRALRDLK